MVRRIGQIIRRGSSTWLVRIYIGHDPETRRRKYVGKFIDGWIFTNHFGKLVGKDDDLAAYRSGTLKIHMN